MLVKSATFIKSATRPAHYPAPDRPEVAFAGRSNVGKSSLINRLVNRRRLVKTSGTPGRTQLINFFDVNDAMYLVDLPGYGYARVPTSVQRTWGPMIERYLCERLNLKVLVLIMDIRRVPRQEEIDLCNRFTRQAMTVLPVLTKADKLTRQNQQRQRLLAAETLGIEPGDLILFSAKSGQGATTVWQAIGRLTASPRPASD